MESQAEFVEKLVHVPNLLESVKENVEALDAKIDGTVDGSRNKHEDLETVARDQSDKVMANTQSTQLISEGQAQTTTLLRELETRLEGDAGRHVKDVKKQVEKREANPSGNTRNVPPIGTTKSRNRQRQRVIKSGSLQDSVKPLYQSEKPCKPTPKQLSAGEIAEKTKTLESEVLFIMDRLTPTNFERLAEEMKKLDIHTYEDLQQLVMIFFDKVTMETEFVEAYAKLCKVMSSLKVPPPPNSDIQPFRATFRVLMLTKCQQEFEADKTSIFEDPEEKRRKMEAELPEGPERDAKIDKTLYDMKMRRLKFLGNIRFIGELFKLNMLTESIMHDCICRLLKAKDDNSLLSLCILITKVGRELDTDKAKARMDQYFSQMAKIAEERESRIKFTLKDVIDLRNNNWVPRKEQTAQNLQEVHEDFQQEQAAMI